MALRGVLFPPPLEYDGSRRDVGDEEDGNRTETDDEGLIRSANVVSTASSVDLILHLGEMYSERNVGVETETETEDGEGGAIEEEDSDDDSDDYYDDDSDDSDDGEDGSDDHTQEEGEDEDEEENKGRVDNGEEKGKDDTVVVSGDDLVLPTCPICFDAWTSEGPHRIWYRHLFFKIEKQWRKDCTVSGIHISFLDRKQMRINLSHFAMIYSIY